MRSTFQQARDKDKGSVVCLLSLPPESVSTAAAVHPDEAIVRPQLLWFSNVSQGLLTLQESSSTPVPHWNP